MSTIGRSPITFAWYFIKKRPLPLLILFLTPLAHILVHVVLPYSLKIALDAFEFHSSSRELIMPALYPAMKLFLGSSILLAILFRLSEWLESKTLPAVEAEMRMATVAYLRKHSYTYFADRLAGKLSSKVNDLCRTMEALQGYLRWNVISTLAVVVASITLVARMNGHVALLLVCWVTVELSLGLYFAMPIHRVGKGYAEQKTTLSGRILDGIANSIAVKLFPKPAHEQTYLEDAQTLEEKWNIKLRKQILRFRSMLDVTWIAALSLLGYLVATSWRSGHISTSGVVFIFNSSWNIGFHTWFLSNALKDIFRDYSTAQQALSTLFMPHEVRDRPDAVPLQVRDGKVQLHDITFGYDAKTLLFKKQQLTIQAHEKVGLVGFSGSGKSTLVNLLLRFFDLQGGKITIDGKDIAAVTQTSLRHQIAMIPQDTNLFHRSIMENIRYGCLEASDEQVIQAAKQAECHHFITQLPEGYATLVGERGTKLSGGQRQRIAIARAILKDAPILILDEATSALDSLTDRMVQKQLYHLMKRRTTIVIAHRISTLVEMDRILVLADGKVVEEGTHEQLLAKGVNYARMWKAQSMGGFLPEERR
jgi:ATP-binding cassette subfamily B protein